MNDTPRSRTDIRPRVALVYPPSGPPGLPSLGLGLLSAGIRRRGFECRTFYWNFDLIAHMPASDLRTRYAQYHSLTGRLWFPFNEWLFSPALYGDLSVDVERDADADLRDLARALPDGNLRADDLVALRRNAPAIVDAMAARLDGFDIVGIASTFYQNLAALSLARRLRQRSPDTIVMIGGANCDGEMGLGMLEAFDFVDYVFSGEVDHAVPEFVARVARGEPTDDIPGLLRRRPDGSVHVGPRAAPLADLDGLPHPDFDDYMAARSAAGIDALLDTTLALESSRGCWWGAQKHCTFCGLNANGMGYRQKHPDRFRDEVETIVRRYDARFLFMTDNILAMPYYEDLAVWARGASVQYFYEIKSNVKRGHVARLADAGITAVQPGIESFSSSILALMRKGTTASQNIAFLKYAREYGVLPVYNLLVGFPGEDPAEYRQMAEDLPKLAHLQPPTSMPEIEFHRFSPYHHTPAEFGLSLRPSHRYRHIYPHLSEEGLSRLVYMFEPAAPGAIDRGYLAPLIDALVRWQGSHEAASTLVWGDDAGDVLIDDARPGFPCRRYRLQGFATKLFHEIDAPQTLGVLVTRAKAAAEEESAQLVAYLLGRGPEPRFHPAGAHEHVIRFAAHEFVADPTGCFAPLVNNGLVYVESCGARSAARRLDVLHEGAAPSPDRRYLALPVREDHRPPATQWFTLGV